MRRFRPDRNRHNVQSTQQLNLNFKLENSVEINDSKVATDMDYGRAQDGLFAAGAASIRVFCRCNATDSIGFCKTPDETKRIEYRLDTFSNYKLVPRVF